MAEVTKIVAEPRDRAGKGSARAARRDGRVPCVIYGLKKAPDIATIPQNEIIRLINRGGFMNHQYDIEISGKVTRVVPKDMQLHPVTDLPEHLDFLRVSADSIVTVEVPVHVIDEEECPGLKRGGVLNLVRDSVEVNAPASAIPEFLEISVKGLELGDQARISLAKMPERVTPTITDRDFVVATIVAPSGLKSAESEEDGEETSEEEGGED